MIGRLRAVAVGVLGGAAKAVLFVGPEYDAHHPARSDTKRGHQARGLPRDDAAYGIIRRTGTNVPRIEMAAEQHNFLRSFSAPNLSDDIGRRHIRLRMRIHREPNTHGDISRQKACDPVRVLGSNRRGRDGWSVWFVLKTAGMRCPKARGIHTAHKRGNRTKLRRYVRTVRPLCHRVPIDRKRRVEQHDPPLDVTLTCTKISETVHNDHVAFYTLGGSLDRAA
jgi:hypothetical protein